MKAYILSAAIVITAIACNNSNEESGYLPGTKANSANSQPGNNSSDLKPNVSFQPQPSSTPVPAANSQTVAPPTAPQQQVQQVVTTAQPQPTAKGMNPPHGQPGHRCDIPVGAPLNSQAQPKTNTATAQVVPANTTTSGNSIQYPTLNNTTAQPAKTKTAPGMNPPHGEPGHRCDIPVGSSLSAKPAAQPTVEAAKPIQLQPAQEKKDSTKQ